jgi:hypothetical protein
LRVHKSNAATPLAACPRFRIIQTKHDVSLFSPYDPRILTKGSRNTAIAADSAISTSAWLLDTRTGEAWVYSINGGFLGDPVQDETPKE